VVASSAIGQSRPWLAALSRPNHHHREAEILVEQEHPALLRIIHEHPSIGQRADTLDQAKVLARFRHQRSERVHGNNGLRDDGARDQRESGDE